MVNTLKYVPIIVLLIILISINSYSLTLCTNNTSNIYTSSNTCPSNYKKYINEKIEFSNEKINIEFYKFDLKKIFKFISEVSGKKIYTDDSIINSISIVKNDITINDLIEFLIENYSIYFEINNHIYYVKNHQLMSSVNLDKKSDINISDKSVKLCDVLMSNGKIYYEQSVVVNSDKSITIEKDGLVMNLVEGVKKIENCVNKEIKLEYTNISNNSRPIGTAIITRKEMPMYMECWQIITTNNIVQGYYGLMKSDTGDIASIREIDSGKYDYNTGYINVAYYFYRYPNIKIDFTSHGSVFKIIKNLLYDESGNVIGKFHHNEFLLRKNVETPNTQGCSNFIGNTLTKVYYWKGSELYDHVLSVNSDHIVFFCNENDAVRNGYKKSLR